MPQDTHETAPTRGIKDLQLVVGVLIACRFTVIGERPEYPAAFVSDGHQTVILWRVEAPDRAVAFDQRINAGLHHFALAVADGAGLDAL